MLIMEIETYKTTYELSPLGKAVLILLLITIGIALADYIRSFIQNYILKKLMIKKQKIEIRDLERRNL